MRKSFGRIAKAMDTKEDQIVEISKEREKFFGTSGKMLIPCPETVASLLAEIPEGRLISTDALRSELASRKGVQVTCPPATLKALQMLARQEPRTAACWRVVKKNGELISALPGGSEKQAEALIGEGHSISDAGKNRRVENFDSKRIVFSK